MYVARKRGLMVSSREQKESNRNGGNERNIIYDFHSRGLGHLSILKLVRQ